MKERHLQGCSEYRVNLDTLPDPPWRNSLDRYLSHRLTRNLAAVTIALDQFPPVVLEWLTIKPGVELPHDIVISFLSCLTRATGLSIMTFTTCDLHELNTVLWCEQAMLDSSGPEWCRKTRQTLLGMWCWSWTERLHQERGLDIRLSNALTDALADHRAKRKPLAPQAPTAFPDQPAQLALPPPRPSGDIRKPRRKKSEGDQRS